MAANDIETKVEAALVAHLAAITGYTVYRGLETLYKGLPGVHAHCGSVVEAPIDTGNYQCEADVVVSAKAQRDYDEDPDPLIEFRNRLSIVRDALNTTDLADSLSAATPGFTCFLALDRGGGTAVDNDNFVATIKRELHACCTAGL